MSVTSVSETAVAVVSAEAATVLEVGVDITINVTAIFNICVTLRTSCSKRFGDLGVGVGVGVVVVVGVGVESVDMYTLYK